MPTSRSGLYTENFRLTPGNILGAQRYLREAVRLDPKFALAWALLSSVDSRIHLTQSSANGCPS